MATLTHSATSITTSASWEASTTQTAQTAKYHFATGGTYLDQDIDLQVTAQTGTASLGPTASNLTLSTTNNGISITGGSITKAGWLATANATTKYVTAVSVPKDTAFTVTTTADTALDSTSNITITNNAYRQLSITNNANGDTNIGGAGRTDFTVGSTTTGSLYATAYIDNGTTTSSGSQTVIANGKWNYHSVTPSASAQGPYYGETKVTAAPSAATPALSITDKASTNLTVGTLSSGYYPFSTSLTGTMTYGTAGWVTTSGSSATDSSVIVGRLAAATGTASGSISGGDLYIPNIITDTSNDSGLAITRNFIEGTITTSTTAGYTPANSSYASKYVSIEAATIDLKGVVLNTGYSFIIRDANSMEFKMSVDNNNNAIFS